MNRSRPAPRRTASFTVVEVMMATLVMMVGFIGLIEAIAVTSKTMDYARRQTLAAQIITHEIEELYLASWATISAVPSTADTEITTIDPQFDEARRALGDDNTAGAVVRFQLYRWATSTNPLTNMREIQFKVTWKVTSSRLKTDGTRLTTVHECVNWAWYGKNGLHLSYRQS